MTEQPSQFDASQVSRPRIGRIGRVVGLLLLLLLAVAAIWWIDRQAIKTNKLTPAATQGQQ